GGGGAGASAVLCDNCRKYGSTRLRVSVVPSLYVHLYFSFYSSLERNRARLSAPLLVLQVCPMFVSVVFSCASVKQEHETRNTKIPTSPYPFPCRHRAGASLYVNWNRVCLCVFVIV
uniref:Uncharacterized protein n=1 Tax=Anopheles dirus TaxID=7168 RepID=A0A182NW65_9DIPT